MNRPVGLPMCRSPQRHNLKVRQSRVTTTARISAKAGKQSLHVVMHTDHELVQRFHSLFTPRATYCETSPRSRSLAPSTGMNLHKPTCMQCEREPLVHSFLMRSQEVANIQSAMVPTASFSITFAKATWNGLASNCFPRCRVPDKIVLYTVPHVSFAHPCCRCTQQAGRMELDEDVDMAQTDASNPPAPAARMEGSEIDERPLGRKSGFPERVRGSTDPRRTRGHGGGAHVDRGEANQYILKLADMGFYNAFDDDFDETDMNLPCQV